MLRANRVSDKDTTEKTVETTKKVKITMENYQNEGIADTVYCII